VAAAVIVVVVVVVVKGGLDFYLRVSIGKWLRSECVYEGNTRYGVDLHISTASMGEMVLQKAVYNPYHPSSS
jgi:hypothetical protein